MCFANTRLFESKKNTVSQLEQILIYIYLFSLVFFFFFLFCFASCTWSNSYFDNVHLDTMSNLTLILSLIYLSFQMIFIFCFIILNIRQIYTDIDENIITIYVNIFLITKQLISSINEVICKTFLFSSFFVKDILYHLKSISS